MSDIKHYWKKKLVNQNIEVEYNSETDTICVVIERKLKNGMRIGFDTFDIHPSYIEPLHELLTKVIKEEN